MRSAKLPGEPYEISPHFYLAMHTRALRLEADAHQDELFAASLEHPAHIQRHLLLARVQREEAARFRHFLSDVDIGIR